MKKWFYVGLAIVFLAALVLNLKRVEQPQKPEIKTIETTVPMTSEVLEIYNKLPDDVNFCKEKILLDSAKKRKLAETICAESNSFSSIYVPLSKRDENDRWLSYIRDELKNKNLPTDLMYVPIAESRLQSDAKSGKGAIGPWQLMKDTAKQYDCVVEPYYDERRDFIGATNAAKKYLTELHENFKNWSAALAGYNAGQDNLQKAFDREGVKDFDFYQLKTIEPETKNFPFRVLATKLIFENPKVYAKSGFSREDWIKDISIIQWQILKVELDVKSPTSIKEIVQTVRTQYPELTDEKFADDNPQILDTLQVGIYTAYIVQKRNGTP